MLVWGGLEEQVCALAADDPKAWARSLRVLFASYDADGRGGSIGVKTQLSRV